MAACREALIPLTRSTLSEKTSRVSPAARSAVAALVVLFAFSWVAVPTLITEKQSADDLTWVTRSLVPWWYPQPRGLSTDMSENGFQNPYYYCVHHPTITRIVYRAALHSIGLTAPPVKRYRYNLSREENMRLGNYLPHRTRTALRLVNFALTSAALLLFYFGLAFILKNRLLALFAVAPIVFEPTLAFDCRSIVNYLGADAFLLFWTALFWFAWLRIDRHSAKGALLLGCLGGLATATKVNGAFLLIAAALYYLVAARGPRRILLPALTAVVSVAVFLALNPVYFGGGFSWTRKVFTDTLRLVFLLKEITSQESFGAYTRFEVVLTLFPYIPFALPLTALIIQARRTAWFSRTLAWTACVALLNLLGVYLFFPRYAATVRIPFLLLLMASAAHYLQSLRHSPPPAAPHLPQTRTAAASPTRTVQLALFIAAAVLSFLALLDLLPFTLLLALVVAAVFAAALLALRNPLAAAAVAAPLALFMPWSFSLKLSAGMLALSLAAVLLYVAWLSLETLADRDLALAVATSAALVAIVISPPSLVFVLVILVRQALRPSSLRVPLLKLTVSLFVAPVAVSILLTFFLAAPDPAGPAGPAAFLKLFSPARPLLWSVPTWSTAGHSPAYDNIVKSVNRLFYLSLFPALAVLAWPLRRRLWFTPTFLWGASLYISSVLFGVSAAFQYSLPIQMALLVPFSIAGLSKLASAFGVEHRKSPAILHGSPGHPSGGSLNAFTRSEA